MGAFLVTLNREAVASAADDTGVSALVYFVYTLVLLHSCLKFVTEFLLCFVFRYFLLILCSSAQRTALHFAALNGHTAACQLLISAEADVNAKTRCAFMLKEVCSNVAFCFYVHICF
jgi:hypothetical protein